MAASASYTKQFWLFGEGIGDASELQGKDMHLMTRHGRSMMLVVL